MKNIRKINKDTENSIVATTKSKEIKRETTHHAY